MYMMMMAKQWRREGGIYWLATITMPKPMKTDGRQGIYRRLALVNKGMGKKGEQVVISLLHIQLIGCHFSPPCPIAIAF
jgi:hypothetical protein